MNQMTKTANTIPVTDFSLDNVEKIIEQVKETGRTFLTKNDESQCVILSNEVYQSLLEYQEDEELITLAEERLKNYDPKTTKTISFDELLKKYNMTEDDLEGWEDVEFE